MGGGRGGLSYFLPITTQRFLALPTDKCPSPQRSAAHAPLLGTSPPLPEPTCPSRGQVGSLCVSRPYAKLPRFVLSECSVGPPYGRGTACGAHILCRGCRGAGLAQNPGLSANSLYGRLLELPINRRPTLQARMPIGCALATRCQNG